jgi:hypothetical protein
MANGEDLCRRAFETLLGFPTGLNALQAALAERESYLQKLASDSAIAACYDQMERSKACEFIGRAREVRKLFEMIAEIRRSQ